MTSPRVKKIGILTYFGDYSNLGTNMQAYCTLSAVRNLYHLDHVEIINYSARANIMRPYLSSISPRSLRNDIVRIWKYQAFFGRELTISRDRLVSTDVDTALAFIRRQHYDALYVGSDTVLELRHRSPHRLTAYWLDGTITCPKFLLAASSHNVIFEALSEAQQNLIAGSLNTYSLLGVRDDATHRLLSHFTPQPDRRLEIVPDPTFRYYIDYKPVEAYLQRKSLRFSKPVVCLHLLRDSTWATTLAEKFKASGYLVASLRPARYADILLTDLAPFEQIGIYRYFSLVITHRFHDAIFSLKNLTPVLVFPEHVTDVTCYGESKAKTLMKAFQIDGSHYMADKRSLSAEYLADIHREAIASFHSKEQEIRAALVDSRDKYEAFLLKSKQFVC